MRKNRTQYWDIEVGFAHYLRKYKRLSAKIKQTEPSSIEHRLAYLEISNVTGYLFGVTATALEFSSGLHKNLSEIRTRFFKKIDNDKSRAF